MGIRREQDIPRWKKDDERAILDIVYTDENGRQVCVDVACIDGAEGGARNPAGFAIQRREKEKHRRYQGAGLYPVFIDARGRWGREALAWAALAANNLESEEKSEMIRKLRVMVSVTVQQHVAEQVLSAGKAAEGSRGE